MIGFACKINSSHDVADPKLNIKSTTLTWLRNQTKQVATKKLEDLLKYNLVALHNQVTWVAKLSEQQRMFRISSDLLPAYTTPDFMPFYFSNEVQEFLETNLAKIGELARSKNVRLSFHPGQFCVLASENPGVVENSVQEFEYHCDIIRYLGYGKSFQDFKCNVHIGGKQGPQGIKTAVQHYLSPEARNCLTIENAEFSWGLDASLELVNTCALVLDIHHHWIKDNEWILATDPRITQIKDSWRGVKPVIHYSQSRELESTDFQGLVPATETNLSKTKLRAHSDYYYNEAINSYAKQHLEWADIMLEAKQKNLAQAKLASKWL
jgi:UV DNA damage repair endonuclease